MEGDLAPVAQRLGDQRKVLDEYFRGLRRGERPGAAKDRPARGALLLHPLQVDRGAGPRERSFHRAAVDLEPAYFGDRSPGEDRHLLARCDRPADHGSRDHGAEPLHREGAVHGEAKQVRGVLPRDSGGDPVEGGNKFREPLAGDGGNPEDRRPLEERSPDECVDLLLLEIHPRALRLVALVEDDDPVAHREKAADVEMLARLRHHPLVRRDDEQDDVDPRRSGHHRPDEPLVSRHINDAGERSRREGEAGEPEFDRDPPLLLLFQTVGIGAGQRAHEGTLPVVDVPGRPEDHCFRHGDILS